MEEVVTTEEDSDKGTKRKMEQQPTLKLYYFDLKGKGECIRLLCAYSGLELNDHRFISRDEFLAMKEGTRLHFGQVPMLEVNGKHTMVQTNSIMRYLGKLDGLYPMTDHILAQKIDSVMDQATDVFTGQSILKYGLRYAIDLTPEAKEKSYEQYNEAVLPTHLKKVERYFNNSSTGWITGTDEPSPADFVWYTSLINMKSHKEISEKIKSLEDYPKIKGFIEKFESLEAIKEYYEKQ